MVLWPSSRSMIKRWFVWQDNQGTLWLYDLEEEKAISFNVNILHTRKFLKNLMLMLKFTFTSCSMSTLKSTRACALSPSICLSACLGRRVARKSVLLSVCPFREQSWWNEGFCWLLFFTFLIFLPALFTHWMEIFAECLIAYRGHGFAFQLTCLAT